MDENGNAPYKFSYGYRRKPQGPTKMEIFKDSVKTVTREYCAESSIGGFKHLVDDSPMFERLLWAIILIIGLICSVSLVWITFQKYYSAPLVTTQMPEGVSVSKIIFPAVGICSNNRISKRAVTELAKRLLTAERNKNYTEEEMMSLLFGLGQLYVLHPMNDDIVPPLKLHEALGEYNVLDLMRNLTPRCEDLLIRCSWNTEPKNCLEVFDFRLTVNGYCCTFNYLRSSDIQFIDKNVSVFNMDMYSYGNKSTFDFDQGLKVLLRLNESDDFFYNIPLQGAQLQFSDAYDFPDAPSGSFAMQIISPGVQMTVMVSASFTEASRDIQHVPIKLRKCRFYDESSYLAFYTYSDCMLKCRMYFLLEKCNCTPFNMPKMENARTCDMRDVACLRLHYAQTITVRPDVNPVPPELELEMAGGGMFCPMCSPTCSKTAYSYGFNNVIIFPEYLNEVPDDDRDDWLNDLFCYMNMAATTRTLHHALRNLSDWCSLSRDLMPNFTDFILKGVNFTGSSFVHVKYAREVADCYGQNVIMKWFDLISNIGSTCGFVTGFSFVSALEFIYFFTVKLFREVSTRNHRKIGTASTIEARLTATESISRYRPIYWNELTRSTNFNHNFSLQTKIA